jgi:type II secretory pathway component GspD/PulD (secretin)
MVRSRRGPLASAAGPMSLRFLLALFLGVSLAFITDGCSTPRGGRRARDARIGQDVAETAETAAAEETLDEGQPADEAAEEGGEAVEAPAPAKKVAAAPEVEEEPAAEEESPAPAKPAKGGKMTPQGMIRLMGLDRESRTQEAAELVKLAKTARQNLEPEKAEEYLEQARKLDPENEEARILLGVVQTILHDKRGEVSQVARELSNEQKVQVIQARAEVRNAINSALRKKDAKDFDGAVADYDKAIQLVRSFPFNIQLDPELDEAQKGREQAVVLGKDQKEEERRDFEKRVRETRETEQKNTVDLLRNRVDELRRKANEAWERKEYSRVEEITAQILALLPEDRDAQDRNAEAREERHLQRSHDLVMEQLRNHERALASLEESTISYQAIFRYPPAKEWEKLQPKTITLEEKIASEESAVEKDIKRKLDEVQTIGFPEKTPFMEVMKVLSQVSGVNFILTKDAQEAVTSEDIKVELPQQRDSPLRSILALILKSATDKNFQYNIDNGAVVIGPKESLQIRLYPEFYDIKDITQRHPDFPAPNLALDEFAGRQTQGGAIDIGSEEEDRGGGDIELQKLIELVQAEMKGPDGEQIGADPKPQGGKLMVKTTLENHQKIRTLFMQLRKATGMMVTVESRFLDIRDTFLEEIGVDMGNGNNTFLPNSIPDIDGAGTSIAPGYEFVNQEGDFDFRSATIGGLSQPLGSKVNPFNISSKGGGAYQLNIFDAEKFQLEAILTGVGKEQEIRRLNSPRVTAFNTQVSHTLVIDQAAYIQDLEVNQTGVIPVINPVIGVLNHGSILEVRPTVSYDRKYVVLEIQPTLAEKLESERALLNLSGNFTSVPVELPVLSVTKIKTTVTIPDGGTVLVGGLKREIDNEASIGVPVLRRIPILNLLFGRMGKSNLRSNLFVLINAKITVVSEEEERLFNT